MALDREALAVEAEDARPVLGRHREGVGQILVREKALLVTDGVGAVQHVQDPVVAPPWFLSRRRSAREAVERRVAGGGSNR